MPKRVTGSAGNDTLHGDAASNIMDAGAGNDLILGDGLAGPRPPLFTELTPGPAIPGNIILAGAGNDTVHAGYGADRVWGGDGDDEIFGDGVLAADAAGSPAPASWVAQARDSDLGDTIYGGNGKDTLHGGGGADLLSGGNGDDVLEGGAGADTLTGGNGADVFRFGAMDSRARLPVFDTGGDVVTDFQQGQDKLDLRGFLGMFAAPPQADILGAGAFTDTAHLQLRSEVQGDHTLVELFVPLSRPLGAPAHGNASFTLLGAHTLLASDFILG